MSEMEALGVVWGLKYFRAYMLGHPTVVYTDHAALKSLLHTQNPSGRLARWGLAIQEINPEIRYRPGKENHHADALSRAPRESLEMGQVSTLTLEEQGDSQQDRNSTVANGEEERSDTDGERVYSDEEILQTQRSDPILKEIIEYLEEGNLPDDEKRARRLVIERSRFEILDGILHYCDWKPSQPRIAVPAEIREAILAELHGGRFAGHFAERSLFNTLVKRYWWDGIRRDVRRHCRSCLTCATRKGPGRATRPPLQPIPIGNPFHLVGIDIIQLS